MIDHRIDTLITLCETLNYTKAAQRLNLTQPAVTQHIKYLEKHYQCKLFEYEGKQLRVTKKGQELSELALEMKNNEKKIYDRMSHENKEAIHVKIGATKSIANYILPKAITKYMLANQSRNISLITENTDKLLKSLEKGNIDIALVEGNFNQHAYVCQVIRKEPFVCVAAKGLLEDRLYRIEELLQQRLIVREEGSGTRNILENYLNGFCYNISCFQTKLQIDNFASIKEMLLEGLGISFLYEMVVKEEIEAGRLVEIKVEGIPFIRPLYFVYSKNNLLRENYKSFIDKYIAAQE